MKEKLQEYALLAEIIGGIGIVASLVFVGLEIKENSKIAEINAFQNLVSEMTVLNRMMVDNEELRNLEVSIFAGDTPLTEEQVNLINPYLRAVARMGQLAFIQYKNGVIDEEKLNSALVPVFSYVRQDETRPIIGFFGDKEYEQYVINYVDGSN